MSAPPRLRVTSVTIGAPDPRELAAYGPADFTVQRIGELAECDASWLEGLT